MPGETGWICRYGDLLRRLRQAGSAGLRPRRAPSTLEAGVVESTTALVCVVDLHGLVMLANAALCELSGYPEHEIVGRPVFDTLVIPEDVAAARAALQQAAISGTAELIEADWLDRSGGRHRIHMHSSVLTGPGGEARAVAYVGTDVTKQRQLQTELRERAETDGLTGLRNRAAMLTALQAALASSPSGSGLVGVLFCDLDGFKQVNDRHGHLVGDALLIEVGQRLLALTRPPQVVGRLGGDEFLLLTPGATPASLTQLRKAIEQHLQRPFLTRNGEVTVGVSVGTALGNVGDNPSQLIEQADRHMYGVKTTSRTGQLRTA
jgi:diguanylate cyclase (GGDEF)-like protein/PAS domain S-box-containing protein